MPLIHISSSFVETKTQGLLLTVAQAWVVIVKVVFKEVKEIKQEAISLWEPEWRHIKTLTFWELHGLVTISPQFNQLDNYSSSFSNFKSCISEKGTFLFIKNRVSPSCLLIAIGKLPKRSIRPTKGDLYHGAFSWVTWLSNPLTMKFL